jgi:HEAT repeat protein
MLLIPVLFLAVFIFAAKPWTPDPIYQGRRASEWLDDVAIGNNRYPEARKAIRALGPRAAPQIIRFLRDRDSDAKRKLFGLLSKQTLVPVHFVPSDRRRRAAYECLPLAGAAALTEAVPVLEERLQDPDVRDSKVAAALLVRAGTNGLPVLIRNLANRNVFVRKHAILGLLSFQRPMNFDDVPEVPYDIWYVPSKSDRNRLAAHYREASLEPLIRCLTDPDPTVCCWAQYGLGIYHECPARVVPALMRNLGRAEISVRAGAASALAEFGPSAKAAVPALKAAAKNDDDIVKLTAARALNLIDSPEGR